MARIRVDLDRCTGCRICELSCSAAKEKLFSPVKSRIRVVKKGLPAQAAVLVCAQCQRATCAEVCPGGAINRDASTGALTVKEPDCIGCGLCVDACPLDAIVLHKETGLALKCDLCGGSPRCVADCPTGALNLYESGTGESVAATRMIKAHLARKGLDADRFLVS